MKRSWKWYFWNQSPVDVILSWLQLIETESFWWHWQRWKDLSQVWYVLALESRPLTCQRLFPHRRSCCESCFRWHIGAGQRWWNVRSNAGNEKWTWFTSMILLRLLNISEQENENQQCNKAFEDNVGNQEIVRIAQSRFEQIWFDMTWLLSDLSHLFWELTWVISRLIAIFFRCEKAFQRYDGSL
jgi:hypothetical protein